FFVKQHRPEYYGLLPDGAVTEETIDIRQAIDRGVKYATEVEEIEFTLRQAMRSRAYWLLMVANAGFMIVPPVLTIHAVPFLTDMGIEPVKAAVIIGMVSIANILGTLISGFLVDRLKKQHLRLLQAGVCFLQVIGFSCFLLNPTLPMVYPLLILHHFSMGIYSPLNRVIISRYFGRKAYGSILGTLMMFMLPASVGAPIYAGWVFDTTGNYITVYTLCMGLLILSTIVVSQAFPPKRPAKITAIHEII
ncbi:MFS transporter, partial [Chloroflexota bacterium]